ncbi:MAG: tRNA uridine-5-carboxymethylaminomethyl(34) synthesis GTPase MnmE [Spirochaetales bacterium]|nr:tRNA uridine-5-carboxymethylaminomethyl(34) synthesis GTPase MnmE [Spirochaetales bacterium]
MEDQIYDTDAPIVALATAWSESALAVIRTSGQGSILLFSKVFSNPKIILDSDGFTIHYGYIIEPETGSNIDEVTVAVYKTPRSYTGQDSVEIFCHGSLPGIESIISALKKAGFRDAAPGEFTMRAFLNGKMDLSQAEAVAEIVGSKSKQAHSLALNRLSGAVHERIDFIKKKLVDLMSLIEVQLDYPDDEIGGDIDISLEPVIEAEQEISKLIDTYRVGKIFHEGVTVALAGGTNAGKSSLFNLFLREDRSIVSEINGTTRDYIESWITIEGIPVRLIDTAGLRDADHPVEIEGIRRSEDIIKNAALVLYVIDGVTGMTEEDEDLFLKFKNNDDYIFIWNKIDASGLIMPEGILPVSAVTAEGFPGLEDAISSRLTGIHVSGTELMIDSLRQKDLLLKAKESLEVVRISLTNNISLDAVAMDLKDSLDAIGEITGEVSSVDILNNIFSGFCVGK